MLGNIDQRRGARLECLPKMSGQPFFPDTLNRSEIISTERQDDTASEDEERMFRFWALASPCAVFRLIAAPVVFSPRVNPCQTAQHFSRLLGHVSFSK